MGFQENGGVCAEDSVYSQEDLQRIKKLRLFDDDFMTKCFEDDPGSISLVLRVVLKVPELEIQEVHTQYFVKNLVRRSIRMDILATGAGGRKFNVEIQREDGGAGAKRARYHSSMIDANILLPREDFGDLPDTYVIFLTENDVMGAGEPVYHIDRCVEETGEAFEDGAHILYVNGAYRGDTPIGRLVHDFRCNDPNKMYYKELAERARYFKESKEGVAVMCKMLEEMREEAWKKGVEEGKAEGVSAQILRSVEKIQENMKIGLEEACDLLAISLEEYESAKVTFG